MNAVSAVPQYNQCSKPGAAACCASCKHFRFFPPTRTQFAHQPHFFALPILAAGSLRKCRLPEFWGQDRTKTRGCGHDTASNFARTYNDWVGLSDFNRPTFADHRRGHKSCQTTGNFLAHVDGLEKCSEMNLRWWAPQEASEQTSELFGSPPGLNHTAQSRQPINPLTRKSYYIISHSVYYSIH